MGHGLHQASRNCHRGNGPCHLWLAVLVVYARLTSDFREVGIGGVWGGCYNESGELRCLVFTLYRHRARGSSLNTFQKGLRLPGCACESTCVCTDEKEREREIYIYIYIYMYYIYIQKTHIQAVRGSEEAAAKH